MRILLAAPDRDLLQCYQKILSDRLGETVATFDGTHVLSLLGQGGFDLVLIDESIPRIEYRRMVEKLNAEQVPVILLLNRAVTTALLTEPVLANAYLSYPFEPDTLVSVARDVLEKAHADERITFDDVTADVSTFTLSGVNRLTARELDILRLLRDGKGLDTAHDGVYVNALNQKLSERNSGMRIGYRAREGFLWVNINE